MRPKSLRSKNDCFLGTRNNEALYSFSFFNHRGHREHREKSRGSFGRTVIRKAEKIPLAKMTL